MRSMTYRLELDNLDHPYLIYNAETTWYSMPEEENLQCPSIRVKNVSLCGRIVADIASCVEVSEFYGDTFEPENDDDLKEERIRHNAFKANYVRILRGELPNWVLAAIRINQVGITMVFFDRETRQEEVVDVNWTHGLEFMLEVDRTDGSGIDTYLIRMSADSQDTKKNRRLKVTEYDAYGKREIVFTPRYTSEEASKPDHDGWEYAYVTEYR